MSSVILTRRELYDLVWAKPLRDVAADLGISDVGLAKVCERHRVPRPEQGYWNKINAGKPARKSLFVDVDDVHLNRVEINGALAQLPEEVRTQIEESRAQRKAKEAASLPRLKTPPTSEPPAEPHKTIALTVRTLKKTKSDTTGTIKVSGPGLCQLEISENSVARVTAFLDRLARLLEAESLSIQMTNTGVAIPRGQDSLSFSIKEKTRRQKHEPTAAELEAEAKREKKKQQYWSNPNRHHIDFGGIFDRTYPEFDVVHTGAMVFEIEGYDNGIRHTWADGKSQTIETVLESIVSGINATLTLRRVRREEQEERERERAELSRRRDLARKRKEREVQRSSYWRKIARTQREIKMLREWLDQDRIDANRTSADNVQRMVNWASARLSALEESITVENVERHLFAKGLFPEVDDLVDPLGDPPEESRYSWQRNDRF